MQGDTHPSTRGRGQSLPAGEEKGITGWMGGRARRRTADPTGWSLSHPVLSIRCLHIRTYLHVTSGLALTRGGFLFYLHILWTYFFLSYLSIHSVYLCSHVCLYLSELRQQICVGGLLVHALRGGARSLTHLFMHPFTRLLTAYFRTSSS